MAGVSAARRLGPEVPRVSVIGYDDLPPGEIVHPRLTTVGREAEQRGRSGAAGLLALLGGAGLRCGRTAPGRARVHGARSAGLGRRRPGPGATSSPSASPLRCRRRSS
nr:substrate-binding domain-containing protein [Streptomyces sp. WMMB 714]